MPRKKPRIVTACPAAKHDEKHERSAELIWETVIGDSGVGAAGAQICLTTGTHFGTRAKIAVLDVYHTDARFVVRCDPWRTQFGNQLGYTVGHHLGQLFKEKQALLQRIHDLERRLKLNEYKLHQLEMANQEHEDMIWQHQLKMANREDEE